jgi:hypothetical protein
MTCSRVKFTFRTKTFEAARRQLNLHSPGLRKPYTGGIVSIWPLQEPGFESSISIIHTGKNPTYVDCSPWLHWRHRSAVVEALLSKREQHRRPLGIPKALHNTDGHAALVPSPRYSSAHFNSSLGLVDTALTISAVTSNEFRQFCADLALIFLTRIALQNLLKQVYLRLHNSILDY